MDLESDQSFFDQQEQVVRDFAAYWHRNQKRKYTGAPYISHLEAVARTVKMYTKDSRLVAVAFCHDLYEDTECPDKELIQALSEAGFTKSEVQNINLWVKELTDEFVKENYPELNRRERKAREAERLWGISVQAQTVKYADMIDNVSDLAVNDPGFGRRYLAEMQAILSKMDAGSSALYKKAMKAAKEAEALIEKSK